MRGEWNGLYALFLKDCTYAYYVHCFAHRLQLELVTSSREVIPIHQFLSKLDLIVNIVGASCKRDGELITAQQAEISRLLSIDELETGKGANQICSLQRAVTTRRSSHFGSVCSLLKMFSATGTVLESIIVNGSNYSQRGDADSAYSAMTSFQFIFILLLMKEVMEITLLCQALQQKSHNISNSMRLVSTTKQPLQKLREDGWATFLRNVESFCESHDIEMPDMNSVYTIGRGKSIHQARDINITIEHHFHFDVFVSTIDTQLKELNYRFCNKTIELLVLSSTLDPSDSDKSFEADNICTLIDRYYQEDFTEQDRLLLKFQLQHYHLDVPKHPNLCHLPTLAALSKGLVKTRKSKVYYLIDRLIRLVLFLPVSTASTERAFSVVKLTKTHFETKWKIDFSGIACFYTLKERLLKLSVRS